MENSALFEKLVYEEAEGGINLINFKDEYKNEVEELIIPDSWNVVAIAKMDFYGTSPFEGCRKLRKVVLPSTLKLLNEAFCFCGSLEEVVFPDNLEELGNWNFRDCSNFKTVKLPHSLKRIGFGNFESSPVYFSEHKDGEDCIYLGEYMLKCVVNNFGTLVIKDGTVLIADCACSEKKFSEVIFPATLRYIGSQAFYCCSNLKKPILPPSIVYIGDEAFYTENGDLVQSIYVTDGYYDKEGRLVLRKELGYIAEAELDVAVKRLEGYLMKIEYENEHSYDNSDDERCEDSYSCYDSVTYRELDAKKNTKALLRLDGEIKGVVFRVRPNSNAEPELRAFLFDGSYGSMTLGYSASHSSSYIRVNRITLVKRGEEGAPEKGEYINFEPSSMSTSI